MTFADTVLRILLASIGWCAAFTAGRMRQAEETWMFGRSYRFTMRLLAIGSAAVVTILTVI